MDASPSSTSPCPGCGKAIDPLRAGHVAIVDGGFRYFCGPSCKAVYADATSKRASFDAMTAEPPAVSQTGPIFPPNFIGGVPASGGRASRPEPAHESGPRSRTFTGEAVPSSLTAPRTPAREFSPSFDAPQTSPRPPSSSFDAPSRSPVSPSRTLSFEAPAETREPIVETLLGRHDGGDVANDDEFYAPDDEPVHARIPDVFIPREPEPPAFDDEDAPPFEPDDELPPETLRSSAIDARAPVTSKKRKLGIAAIVRGLGSLVAPLGVGAGVLSSVVSLAGDTGSELRLPLALVATVVLAGQAALRPRDRSEPSPWVLVAPVVVAAALATAAVMSKSLGALGPRSEAYAMYAGLAAAAALLADLLVSRSRRDVIDARARVAAGLAVRVRVVTRFATDGGGRGEETEEVDAADVKPGEQVVVEAGETVGVDGIVAAGTAEVAPWIDSPVVVAKREGDAVVAGATIVSGRLRVTTTFAGAERAWLKLTQANDARVDVAAPLVVFGRRIVERSVPIAAFLVAGATYANNAAWPDVVIAACAGAYALSAAAAVSAVALAQARGHVAAQLRGIVYKDALAFDVAARADIAVVCSRGTILLGEPEIVVVEASAGKELERVLALAAGAEMASTDAVAAAILREARGRGVRPENVRSALVHPGLGVTALVQNGDKVIVGSRAFLLKEKVSVAISDSRVSELEAQGRSVVLVSLGGRLVGLLALQDGLRPGARAAVQRMHDARIEPVLLSGEARETCETIARALDIEHVRPEVLPADRGAEVRALADGGHVVAAIGHSASDDGALGSADVSVAMGAAGSAPGEWGVALASDDVRDASLALTVPRACRDRAKTAAIVCAGAQALSSLGIAFGIAPPVFAPVVGVLACVAALAIVREPTTTRR